ncbi:MAG: RNA 2',3'-cyclic phosphodiesterase [Candidatus Nanoarchaeia archaeon]|nr:RNA 2',3'-cyclic phosphodiesterase [Candidatus Nanoarchaeia archaeon]
MRIFIALELESDKLRQLQNQFEMEGIKSAKALHITFKFFGEIDEVLVEKIKQKLGEIKFDYFEIETTKIGIFPETGNKINVVWVGIKSDKLLELQNIIDEKLSDLVPKEKRFNPHITLGRVKFVIDKKALLDTIKNVKVDQEKFLIKEFKLIESILTEEGYMYKDIAKFKLQ